MAAEVIIALCTAVIAFCALAFSIWQAKIIRDHNKMSVRPHLTTWNTVEHEKGKYAVHVLNNGIGPAVIKKYEIRVDDKVVAGEGTEPVEKALKIVFPNQPYQSHNAYMAPGFALATKEGCCITSVQFLEGFNLNKEQIEHGFDRSDLIIEYESFYGDVFTLDTRIERLNKSSQGDAKKRRACC